MEMEEEAPLTRSTIWRVDECSSSQTESASDHYFFLIVHPQQTVDRAILFDSDFHPVACRVDTFVLF